MSRQIQLRETPYKGGGNGTFGGRLVAGEYEAEQLVGRYRIGNALLVCLVEYGTQHAHIGGDGIVAPAFLQQAFFVSFYHSRRHFLEGKGGVAGKIPETVDGAGIQVGCAVAAGASGFFDCALRKGVYGSHNLNFKLDNELDKQAISKKDLR